MKKYIYLILILTLSAKCFSFNTLHVQGLVSNSANGLGIPNHKIYITDNLFYNDSIVTGSNGYYTLLITNVNPSTIYTFSTRDCNNVLFSASANSSYPVNTINFTICFSVPMNCQNGFSYTKQNNKTLNFTGSNISTYPTIYYWNFGDGYTATGQNVTHTYPQPTSGINNYTVTLNTKTIYPSDTCYYQSIQNVIVSDTIPMIKGKVTANDSLIQNAWVALFGINNPVGSCIALDTAYIDNQGNYYFSSFPINYPAYILKAEFPYGSVAGNYYIPTYYDTLYSWMNSPPVYPKIDTTAYNIKLMDFLPNQLSGIGSISGSLSNGKKSTNSILQQIDILLINQFNQVLKRTKPNLAGNYYFTNLPFSNYKVYVELPGKITIPANVTINNSTYNINNLNFVINDNVIILAVNDENELQNAVSEVYPNPATQEAFIDFSFKKPETIQLNIYNQFGQNMLEKSVSAISGSQRITLDINNLSAGFYTLVISNKTKKLSRKLIKL